MRTILLKNSHTFRLALADPTPIAEDDFEKTVIATLRDLYPECVVFPFKPIVIHNGVGWKPDLALVSKDFAFWFVIEVEVASHSLEKHVLPQVRAFRLGDYGEQAGTILARELSVSRDRAETLIRFVPRYTAVVTNHEDELWGKALAAENTQLVTIASYCTESADRTALFVSGSLAAAQRSLGFGKVVATMQVVKLPAGTFWKNQTYRITDPHGSANWICHIEAGIAWLTKKQGLIQLPDDCWIQMIQQHDEIELRPFLTC